MNYEEYIKSYVNRKDSWSLVMGSEDYDNRPLLEKEENLYKDWLEHWCSPDEQKQFCMDGLLFGRNKNSKDEEAKKWIHAKRRVLFLMKDTNGTPMMTFANGILVTKPTLMAHQNHYIVFI